MKKTFPSQELKSFQIDENKVKTAIDLLPAKSAPGPDGVPNLLIKQFKHELTPVLN